MILNEAAILAQTPHFVTHPIAQPFGLEYEDVAAAVRAAMAEVEWVGGDPDNLRLIAYASYSGAFSDDEAAARMIGSDEHLADDVLSAIQRPYAAPFAQLSDLIRSVIIGHTDNQIRAADAFEGWAISLLELVFVARPSVIHALLARDDDARLVLRWLLGRWLKNDDYMKFAATLLQECDDVAATAAAAFLIAASRSHVERGDTAPQVPAADADRRLETLGIVLTETFKLSGGKQFNEEQRTRWESLVASLRDDVAMNATTAKSTRRLRSRVGVNDTSLVALIGAAACGGAAAALSREGDGLLRRYFRPLTLRERDVSANGLPYLAPLVIDDLSKIWVDLRADAGFFDDLRVGLRYGEFSFAFTYGHYLIDRPRAIILAAIAATAAQELADQALLDAALSLAASLHGLPPGVSPPFNQEAIHRLREQTGIDLPLDRSPDLG
jgi:hypothetical protein